MAKKINFGWLKDQDGNRFAPKTFISKVITTSGKTLESILEKIENTLSEKISSPSSAKVGQNLTVKEVDENGKPVSWKCVDVQDQVQADYNQTDSTKPDYIKNKPTNLVKNTDYASSTKAGLVKTSSSYGAELAGGYLQIVKATNDEILARANNYKPIVPSSLDYAVKVGFLYGKTNWTNDEKIRARDRIGAISKSAIPEQQQADWEQNLETEKSFIKNRPFYEKPYNPILDDYWSASPDDILNLDSTLVENKSYVIRIDDVVSYEGLFNGEPIVVYDPWCETYECKFYIESNRIICESELGSSGVLHFEILEVINEVKQLDEKFIPDSIKKRADWVQNDESDMSFIQNRPFYEYFEQELKCSTIFDGEVTLEKIDDTYFYYFNSAIPFYSSTNYHVYINDTLCFNGTGSDNAQPELRIDNFNNEGITICIYENGIIFNSIHENENTFHFRIDKEDGYEDIKKIKTLDEKFIPDNIPKISTADIGQTLIVEEIDENGKPVKWNTIDIPDTTNDIKHGENFLSDLININLLDIDYDTLLAFDTSEIVIQSTATATSSVLGQAILGQMILG